MSGLEHMLQGPQAGRQPARPTGEPEIDNDANERRGQPRPAPQNEPETPVPEKSSRWKQARAAAGRSLDGLDTGELEDVNDLAVGFAMFRNNRCL